MPNINEGSFPILEILLGFTDVLIWAVPATQHAGNVRLPTEISNEAKVRASVNYQAARS